MQLCMSWQSWCRTALNLCGCSPPVARRKPHRSLERYGIEKYDRIYRTPWSRHDDPPPWAHLWRMWVWFQVEVVKPLQERSLETRRVAPRLGWTDEEDDDDDDDEEEKSLAAAAAEEEELPDYLLLGLTIAAMKADWMRRRRAFIAGLSLSDVVNGYHNREAIAAETARLGDGLAVCQRMHNEGAAGVGRATVFFSLWLGTPLSERLSVLEHFLQKHGLDPDATFFWVCDFSVRQTDVNDAMMTDVRMLPSIIGSIGHTLLLMEPWDAPSALSRVWCVYEVCHTKRRAAKLELGMSRAQAARFLQCLIADFDKLLRVLSRIDVRHAQAHSAADKKAILAEAEESLGVGALNGHVCGALQAALADEARSALREQYGTEEARLASDLADQLGRLLMDVGHVKEAEALLRACVAFRRRRPGGEGHADTHRAMTSLAWLLSDKIRHRQALREAESLHRAVHARRKEALGPRHADTLRAAHNRALVLALLGRIDEAEALFREAATASREEVGELHEDTLRILGGLARVWHQQGRLADAEGLMRTVVDGTARALGRRHISTITRLNALAGILKERGGGGAARERADEARALFAEVAELRRETNAGRDLYKLHGRY